MPVVSRRLLSLAVASCLAGAALTAVLTSTNSETARAPYAAVASTTAPKGELPPAARLAVLPAPGTVTELVGPFDDRFTLAELRLTSGVVTSKLRVTSDVSEIIDFEIVAAFYDAKGGLLGTARQGIKEGDGSAGSPTAENGGVLLRLAAAPAYLNRVASVQVRVPIMVNE